MNETMLMIHAAANAGNGAAVVHGFEALYVLAGGAVIGFIIVFVIIFLAWDILAELFGKQEDEYDMYYPPKEDKTKEINNKEGNDK